MEPEVVFGEYYVVESDEAMEIVPVAVTGTLDLTEFYETESYYGSAAIPEELSNHVQASDAYNIDRHEGWGARMYERKSGDATGWTLHGSADEAYEYLASYYGSDGSEVFDPAHT